MATTPWKDFMPIRCFIVTSFHCVSVEVLRVGGGIIPKEREMKKKRCFDKMFKIMGCLCIIACILIQRGTGFGDSQY